MAAPRSAQIPVAMHLPRTTLGVERRLFYWIVGIGVLLFTIFRSPWVVPIPLVGIIGGAFLTVKFPDLVSCYMKFRKQGDHYRPWGEPRHCNRRPEGYCRDMAL